MFKLNCILISSIRNVCRQGHVDITGGSALQRALCSSGVGSHEETALPITDSGNSPRRPRVVRPTDAGQSSKSKEFSLYPPMPGEDSTLRWAGQKFEELPIAHIKATYNNTHIQVTDSAGVSMVRVSCGTEGFKNIKKSTPTAAQTTGISAASKATGKGVTYVRVVVKGLGQGRLAAIKGLTMGGLEVVSITDNTPVPHNGCRPRKARRI